jgi:hypothetical protein
LPGEEVGAVDVAVVVEVGGLGGGSTVMMRIGSAEWAMFSTVARSQPTFVRLRSMSGFSRRKRWDRPS